MRTLRRILPIGLVAATVLTACDVTEPDSFVDEALLNYNVAVVSADATIQNLEFMNAPVGGGIPGFIFPTAQGPQLQGCLQSHTFGGCGKVSHEGFTISRDVTFFDENDIEQEAYDALLTSWIYFSVDATGQRDTPNWSATIERHRDMTVSGLLGEETERTWNGTGENMVLRSRTAEDSPIRSYDMNGSSTISDVVVPYPRTEGAWPTSGTITRNVHVVITEDGTVVNEIDRLVVITFNGTQFVDMTVNGESFTIDLTQRKVQRGRRNRQGNGFGGGG